MTRPERPRKQPENPDLLPTERPPWMTEDQYQAFLKTFVTDLGAQCITARSADVEPLSEDQRRDLLSGVAVRSALHHVGALYARLDIAARRAQEGVVEREVVQAAGGELAVKLSKPMRGGSRLMPPPALNQLLREVIEWGSNQDSEIAAGEKAENIQDISDADLIRMVLSINGDQEAQSAPDFFDTWPPTPEEQAKYKQALSADDDLVLREMQNQMVWEFARMQTNAIALPVMVLGDTYDTWFKGWPPATPYDLIGEDPSVAFANATGVTLREFINL